VVGFYFGLSLNADRNAGRVRVGSALEDSGCPGSVMWQCNGEPSQRFRIGGAQLDVGPQHTQLVACGLDASLLEAPHGVALGFALLPGFGPFGRSTAATEQAARSLHPAARDGRPQRARLEANAARVLARRAAATAA